MSKLRENFCLAVISVPSSLFVLVLKPKKFSMFNDTSDTKGEKDEAAADSFCFD